MSFVRGTVGVADFRAGIQHLLAEAVAGLEHQHVVAAHLGGPDRLAPGPRVAARHHCLKRFVVKRVGLDARHVEGQREDRRIHRAVLEVVGQQRRHAFLDVEAGVRRSFLHGGDQLRQQVGADGMDDAQAEIACQRVLSQLGDLLDAPRLVEGLARLPDHLPAEVGEGNVTLAALDEGNPQFGLEILQGDTQGGLADLAFFSRLAERSLVGKGDQIT